MNNYPGDMRQADHDREFGGDERRPQEPVEQPPKPPNTAWSLPAEWLTDMADMLEWVRHEDGAPKRLTPDLLLELVRDLRDDRDYWRGHAAAATFAAGDP